MNNHRYLLLVTLIALTLPCSAQLLGRGGKTNAKARSGVIRMKQFTDQRGTFFWSHFDATKRSSVNFIDAQGNVRILAEVQPDAAMQRATELVASAEWQDVSAEAKVEIATTIAELGQRTSAVNMLRDGLYRIAELRYNDPARYTPDIVERLMVALFNMVEHIATHTDATPEQGTSGTTAAAAEGAPQAPSAATAAPAAAPQQR